jgi:hypothetical protein
MKEEPKDPPVRPAWEQSWSLQRAYDFLNDELFEGKLPPVMLTLSRNNNIIGGYYTPERWFNEEGNAVGEIAINANCLKSTGAVRAMVVLCHEMVHLWQHSAGKPSRAGYHNQEWADMCKSVGLQPFTIDDKETGQAVDTRLIPGGKAEKAIADMPEDYTLPWMTQPMKNPFPEGDGEGGQGGGQGGPGSGQGEAPGGPGGPSGGGAGPCPPTPRKPGSRQKYTCPACGFNLWGKPGGHFECLDCNQMVVEMTGMEGAD